jgi:hypothetical protein
VPNWASAALARPAPRRAGWSRWRRRWHHRPRLARDVAQELHERGPLAEGGSDLDLERALVAALGLTAHRAWSPARRRSRQWSPELATGKRTLVRAGVASAESHFGHPMASRSTCSPSRRHHSNSSSAFLMGEPDPKTPNGRWQQENAFKHEAERWGITSSMPQG